MTDVNNLLGKTTVMIRVVGLMTDVSNFYKNFLYIDCLPRFHVETSKEPLPKLRVEASKEPPISTSKIKSHWTDSEIFFPFNVKGCVRYCSIRTNR